MESKDGIIYVAHNTVNDMRYIGQTINSLQKRKHGGYNKYLTNAIKKYGNLIKWSILEIVEINKLDEMESYYIQKFNSMYPNGYNFESGGNKNKTVSLETKIKMSKSHVGKKMPSLQKKKLSERMIGNKYALGLMVSELHKNNISKTNRGKVFSDNHRDRISKSLTGNKNGLGKIKSPETRFKLSRSNTGKKRIDAVRQKWVGSNNPMFGKKHSKETRSKISIGNLGKKLSDITKEKIGSKNAKNTYIITNPNNESFIIYNITKFCKENNLTASALVAVSNNKRNHHKGYKCEKLEIKK